jgi:DNA-binding response OmpR family regulator
MRVLLVEDDASLGPWLQAALQEAGYAADLCASGTDAEALGDIEPYDLVLLDLGLPDRPGLEVLAGWRARMESVLKRSRGLAAGPLRQAGIELDEATQSLVERDGGRIELTGTEFRLLRYFMLHPGRLLSKSQLADHIYEYDGDKDSNVIEVYVNRLRQKVGRGLIQTRRGQGYVFGATNGQGEE